ncbi:MAG: SEC-C metal-binding domain-containing protein [Planctomycetota bacterium]
MIELKRIENTDAFQLSLDGPGENEETYAGEGNACPSPCCPCQDVTLNLRPVSKKAQERWPTAKLIVLRLDVFEKCLDTEDEEGAQGVDRTFGEDVAARLAEPHWSLLQRFFLEQKADALESLDPKQEVMEFPFDEVDRKGLLLRYNDVFPFAPSLSIDMEGRRYEVDDLYCLRNGCGCTDTALVFLGPEEIDEEEPREECALRFDYERGKWVDEQGAGVVQGKPLEFKRALEEQVPELRAELAKRHKLLRRIYSASRARLYKRQRQEKWRPGPEEPLESTPTLTAAPRPGRNDPCPCGSGKKFKRCCGAK